MKVFKSVLSCCLCEICKSVPSLCQVCATNGTVVCKLSVPSANFFSKGAVQVQQNWSQVQWTWTISRKPLLIHDLKWWYFRARCFVLGVNLRFVAIEIHASLSSNTLQYNFGFGKLIRKITSSSVMNRIKGIVSRIAWEKSNIFWFSCT